MSSCYWHHLNENRCDYCGFIAGKFYPSAATSDEICYKESIGIINYIMIKLLLGILK